MSKDKSHKKDKSKKHDLFSLMQEQSEVFRDMVAHFQNAWTPKLFAHKGNEAAHTDAAAKTVIAKKATRSAKSAKKPVAKAAPVSKKPKAATAAKKPATKKSSVKKAPASKNAKPIAAKKSTAKTARHPAKKSPAKK
ncbi:hypothetical protein [Dyella sp. S184]|uniref:hypothetical protein n=1 Tax=Dyella sp. S184 TaxID=1641862 RepID=UPI0020B16614|nr:hypothetical protein [Dyella sp. S184]